jgi:DNA-binding winged helix-turn-helix (wHTH) protein/Flp pilus assembly protein TadD
MAYSFQPFGLEREVIHSVQPSPNGGSSALPASAPTKVRFDAFELDAASVELRKSGILVKLQPQPCRVLSLLIEHAGQLVTREEIRRCLWKDSTFVDYEHGINFSINQIRVALADNAEEPRYVETLPRRGYRFIGKIVGEALASAPVPGPANPQAHATGVIIAPNTASSESEFPPLAAQSYRRFGRWAMSAITIVILLAALPTYRYFRGTPTLTEKDTIIIADFANSTGDPVFDDALKQALSIQLAQSPFLDILSDRKVSETLRMMGRSPDERLTNRIAQEICERTGSKAMLSGAISSVGSRYLLGVKAINCATGDSFIQRQVQAASKDEVVNALGELSTGVRRDLGESLSNLAKFDTPLAQATTPSLDALKALSLGRKALVGGDSAASVPPFQYAVSLDPNLAIAYAGLSESYSNLGENSLAAENARKAYELRDRVTELERFIIESNYYSIATGDLEKARQTFELMSQTYPRNSPSHFNLGNLYTNLGQYEKGLSEALESFRLSRGDSMDYAYLAFAFVTVGRLKEARATVAEALAKSLDSPSLRTTMYMISFLQNDSTGMAEQLAWAAGKPGVEDVLLEMESSTAAYFGQINRARELSSQAIASAERAKEKETAAGYEADEAIREALFGDADQARRRAAAALSYSKDRDVLFGAAFALASAGRPAQAQRLAEDLAKQFPEDTIVQLNYLPTIRARVALAGNDALTAIKVLQAAAPYELGAQGTGGFAISLYPVYVRGQAYLAARRGHEAAVEFQKIVDHPEIPSNEAIIPAAQVGLARAYALQGDGPQARAAYQNFFARWKNADPDTPILQQARSQYDFQLK